MRTIFITVLIALLFVKNAKTQIEVLSDPLFNGTEGIAYDAEANQYFVGNATDGKLLTIDSDNNVSVFKESIGADMLMSLEIWGDSLFITSNYPRTITCLDKNTGDSIYQLILDTLISSIAQMAIDFETGYIYATGQSGKVLKIDSKNATASVFVETGLPTGCQSIEIDKTNNRLLIFTFSSSSIKFVNLSDSTDITNGPAIMSGQNTCSAIDSEGYIYISSWIGSRLKKVHMDSLDNISYFCQEELNKPVGIAFNTEKNEIAVCNYGNSTVTLINKNYFPEQTRVLDKKVNSISACYNQFSRKIIVTTDAITVGAAASITDMRGREIERKLMKIDQVGRSKAEFNTSNIQKGTYLITVINKQGYCSQKVQVY